METMSTSEAGSAHGSPSPSRRPAHPSTVQEAEFVGREPELAVLDALLAQVRTDGARVVLIRGGPGIGKTALVREFLRRHGNLMVMRGQRRRGRGHRLLHPRRPALRGRRPPVGGAAGPHRAGAAGRGTGRGGPADARGAHPVQRTGPDGRRGRRRELGRRRLAARAALRPAQASRTPRVDDPGGAVRTTAACRPDSSGSPRDTPGPACSVGPLAPGDVAALATAVSGSRVPGLTAHRLCAHTLGNPRHLLALLAETPPDRWRGWEPVLPAPRMFSRTIVRRLAACSDGARLLVEAVAALGDGAQRWPRRPRWPRWTSRSRPWRRPAPPDCSPCPGPHRPATWRSRTRSCGRRSTGS